MNPFKAKDNNPFDRQERIGGWSQEKLRNAKVLVIGVGAIGNETLKNLALLGIGSILLCDMDTISISNLSRTVLFRKEDAGKGKAEIAAMRLKDMALEETCKIDFFNGDIVWELGSGVYRYFDIVLGCLDNVETRFNVNKYCQLISKPWIDAGINELAGSISVFGSQGGACYQCNADKTRFNAARQRYSCDDFKKRAFNERKMPTVQISSAIVSAIQVQEAVKIICEKQSSIDKKIFFQGTTNEFDVFDLNRDESCMAHAKIENIVETPFTNDATLKEFLMYVSEPQYSGNKASLDLRGDRSFLRSIKCATCGKLIVFNKPSFRLYSDELICQHCKNLSIESNTNNFAIQKYD